jgi:predicted AlkP superfamily pyrophosphatase or phosphodiesterase
MINQEAIEQIEKARLENGFVRPLYESYCFSRIPSTISDLLNGVRSRASLPIDTIQEIEGGYDTVILLFIDGFGWRFFTHYLAQYPLLQNFVNDGIVTKITSQFPSTTAGHVTCIHTGLDVGTSGIYEWFYYEPTLDRVIAPLLTSYAGDKEIDTLRRAGVDPSTLYPLENLYKTFKSQNIETYILQNLHIAHSTYSKIMCRDAHCLSFDKLDDGLHQLVELVRLQPATEKRYICLYLGDIDAAGHRFGLFSPEYNAAVNYVMVALQRQLCDPLQKIRGKCAILATADHGMIQINPKTTFYLNRQIPELLNLLKRNEEGALIAPAGSSRDFFLHVQDKYLDRAEALLLKRLKGMAWVVKTEELILHRFFGEQPPSKRFLDRVGNLVLLPYGNRSIWWYEKGRFDQHFFAMHGGLTQEEMESIFLFMRTCDSQ